MKKLDGKVAFITGGARGMGRQIGLRFAEEGASVAFIDIDKSVETIKYSMASSGKIKETEKELQALGVGSLGMIADVRSAEQIEAAVQQTVDKFGKIDILVTSAGILGYGNLWELTEKAWDDMIDINVKGTWLAMKYVVPHMIRQGSGKVVCIASVNGLRGGPNVGHYVTSKHAVLGLVKVLAQETGPHNIHVNAICPTAVDTEMANNQATYDRLAGKEGATRDEATPTFQNHHFFPIGFIPPEPVANTALFLASEESQYISGDYIAVDAAFLTY